MESKDDIETVPSMYASSRSQDEILASSASTPVLGQDIVGGVVSGAPDAPSRPMPQQASDQTPSVVADPAEKSLEAPSSSAASTPRFNSPRGGGGVVNASLTPRSEHVVDIATSGEVAAIEIPTTQTTPVRIDMESKSEINTESTQQQKYMQDDPDALQDSTRELLDRLGIVYGLQPNPLKLADVDVDPSLSLINHIWDCMSALNDVNKRYRKRESKASVIGSLCTFGFNMEIGRIVNNLVTMDAFVQDDTANDAILSTAVNIFKKFPNVARNQHKDSGRALIHHLAHNVSPHIAADMTAIHTNLFPKLTGMKDKSGAIALHWATVNKRADLRAIKPLIDAFPPGCATRDSDGLTPLHWAVMKDEPDHDIIKLLINSYPKALDMAANDGSYPIHALLKKQHPSSAIISTVVQSNLNVMQKKDNEGMLPIHKYINRGHLTDMEIVWQLLDAYPKCSSRTDNKRRTALHIAVDHPSPSEECVKALLLQYSRASELPDLDGYLPLHYCLDGDRSSPSVAKILIQAYPPAVSKATNDGYLPLHCLLCNDEPDLDLLKKLIQLFPQGVQQVAVDLMPIDETADPLTWTGPVKEKRWTPLSRAIERGLLEVINILQAALPKSVVSEATDDPSAAKPLSALKPVRPLPSGFLPPSLRQAAYFAKKINVGRTIKHGEDEKEGEGEGSMNTKKSGVPNPAIYFNKKGGNKQGDNDEESQEDIGDKIEIVVQRDRSEEEFQ